MLITLTIVYGSTPRELERCGSPVVFAGVVRAPDGVALEDIPRLYGEWKKLGEPDCCFTDWLLHTTKFVEEQASYVYLYDAEYDGPPDECDAEG